MRVLTSRGGDQFKVRPREKNNRKRKAKKNPGKKSRAEQKEAY